MKPNTDKEKAEACQKTPTQNPNMKTDTQTDALAGHRQGIATLQRKAAQADKLAEELRKLFEIVPYSGTISAREALEAYEKEMQS